MDWVTAYGVAALSLMMLMYWLEHRGPMFILGFAAGCLLSSVYGFLAGRLRGLGIGRSIVHALGVVIVGAILIALKALLH